MKTVVVCPCGRPNQMKGKSSAKCTCGRTLTVRIQAARGMKSRRKGSLKKKAGQTLKQLQGLFIGAGFVLLLITAVALVSLAGR